MKVVLLAGGFGTRLAEYTDAVPKPMVTVGGRPILWHIMQIFAKSGFKDFNVALGYRAEVIKDYFLKYRALNSDFSIDLGTGEVFEREKDLVDWRVTLVDTGLETMTGGRLKRMSKLINDGTFLFTYGDGLANIDFPRLLDFHRSHGKLVTVTAVHPDARFGELEICNDTVMSFKEKPQTTQGWVNGGYFVIEPEFLDFIDGDQTILEREPLEKAANLGQLAAYRHEGFWQCMDTKRDRDKLEAYYRSGRVPWL